MDNSSASSDSFSGCEIKDVSSNRSFTNKKKLTNSDRLREKIALIKRETTKYGVYSACHMAACEFRYTGKGDSARCDRCGLIVDNWTMDMNPLNVHADRSSSCPFVQSIKSSSSSILPVSPSSSSTITVENSLTSSGRPESYSKRMKTEPGESLSPAISLFETNLLQQVRKRTFSHWPHRTDRSITRMIEAGFFSCNVGDQTICIYCGLLCKQWTDNDDPCEIHKLCSRTCPYVCAKLKRTKEVQSVFERQRQNQTSLAVSTEQLSIPDQATLDALLKARLDLPISCHLRNEGFEFSIVSQCWKNQLELKKDDFADDMDLYIACVILQKQNEHNNQDKSVVIPENIKKQNESRSEMINITTESSSSRSPDIVNENRSSYSAQANLCDICLTEQRQHVCLPCGHMFTCSQCGPTQLVCRKCKKTISTRVPLQL
ncbi:unnamed protein product [Adineta ricciae]|uniref:RING-type domain-containing protein n=1 Tax=Adineta ricciae TaxID=249248 RepID=A0A816BWY7_ADIRI|nr:unnamed protein product [Adineta ricciae]CAF1615897.1 unnamed protein product [Adineta ricciae]